MKLANKEFAQSYKKDLNDFFNDLYHDLNKGNYILMQGAKRELRSVKDGTPACIGKRKYFGFDIFYSINLYKNTGTPDAHEYNLYTVNAIAVDVDFYKTDIDKLLDISENMDIEAFIGTIIHALPFKPNWVEYSHGIRLIFILKEPIWMGQKGSKKAFSMTKLINQRLCELITEETGIYCDKGARSAKYARLPGCRNSKNDSIVELKHICDEKLTWQEMLDYFELPEWYEEWKLKQGKKDKKKIKPLFNAYTFWLKRKAFFESVADVQNINRYNLCFLYACALVWLNEYSIDAVYEFNKKLAVPLQEKELKSKLHYIENDKLRFSDDNIISMLGIDEDLAHERGIGMTKREFEKQQKILNGTTRKQIAEKEYQTAKALIEQGLKVKDICEKMNKSERMVKYYRQRYKEENGLLKSKKG